MTNIKLLLLGVMVAALTGLGGCTYLFSGEDSLPAVHPEKVEGKNVQCSECHSGDIIKSVGKPYSTFNHNAPFYKDHAIFATAGNNGQLCTICHTSEFCLNCHATKPAIEPTRKFGDDPEFEFSHRGDYRTRHQFDGAVDPVSCYKCHGRGNNEVCKECHRKAN
jgi:hypothetical protein